MERMKHMPSVGNSLRLVMQASLLVTVAGAVAFLYVRLRDVIIGGFDSQLVAASSTVSAALRAYPVTDCLHLSDQSDSAMRALPEWRLLRCVQEEAGLTYAYTFSLAGDSAITYLVDGSPDGEACPIGHQEQLPDENMRGLLAAWRNRSAFVSRVLRFEEWGLLKVSAMPVLDSAGAPAAMVGSDLEVTIIRRQLRSGVFLALALSLLVLAATAWLAQYTRRRLLDAVRDTTRSLVAIAAGDTAELLPVDRGYPLEIARMNADLNSWISKRRREAHTGQQPAGDTHSGETAVPAGSVLEIRLGEDS
jgi:hypothetical protein